METGQPKITDEMREALRAPLPSEAIQEHPTKNYLSTIKAIYVAERLNDVFGVGRWDIVTQVVDKTDDYVLMKGTFVCMDYGVVVPSQYGGHKTTGTGTELADGYKSAVTDCLSKCSSYLEIGIEVYKGLNDNGKKKAGKPPAGKKKSTPAEIPACPKCKKSDAVIQSKEEYGGGWVCFAKKGGCGESWGGTKSDQEALTPDQILIDGPTTTNIRFALGKKGIAEDEFCMNFNVDDVSALVVSQLNEARDWVKAYKK